MRHTLLNVCDNAVQLAPEEASRGLRCQADEFCSSPALSTASPLRSAGSAPGGRRIYTQGAPSKMDCASHGEGKLKLVIVHIDEARSCCWGVGG